jgi:hypothetical protein
MALHPSVAANQAIGATVLSLFGAVWLVAWCVSSYGVNYPILGLVAVAALAMSVVASKQFRTHRKAYGEHSKSTTGRRQNVLMGVVNSTQWILIFVAVITLRKLQYSPYIVPAVIFIVGAHFIPLAMILKYKPYWLTAAALCALAIVYPLLGESGPENTIGLLGAGVILWTTGLGLIRSNAKQGSPSQLRQIDA